MIIGMDLGASALKIVGVENDKVVFTHAENNREKDVSLLLRSVIAENGADIAQIDVIAITGVGAERVKLSGEYKKVVIVPEIEATGEGGTYLAGIGEAVVVSLGTGTSLVLVKDGKFSHVGGSGVGSGTVRGLAKKLLGKTDLLEFFSIAEKGNCSNIDLQIHDLFSGTDTLPPDLTASNLAKCLDGAADSDWAAAVINMVLEVAGSHAALAGNGFGVKDIIITGGLSQTKIAAACYEKFDRLYPQHFVIPKYSAFATAIGATRRV